MDGVYEPFVGQIEAMSISARLWRLTKSKANRLSYARHSTSDQALLGRDRRGNGNRLCGVLSIHCARAGHLPAAVSIMRHDADTPHAAMRVMNWSVNCEWGASSSQGVRR